MNVYISEPVITGYIARPPTFDDLPAFRDLVEQMHYEYYGSSSVTVEDLEMDWRMPNYDIERSSRSVFTEDGRMVGHIAVWDVSELPVRPWVWAYVHPEHRRRGIGTALHLWAEERCRQVFDRVPDDARVVMVSATARQVEAARDLLQKMGMGYTRSSYAMLIEMAEAPPAPAFPQGIRIVTYNDLQDVQPFASVHLESFRDHRGFVETSVERYVKHWQHIVDTDKRFSPDFWLLAMAGEEPAAVLMGREQDDVDPDMGWVMVVGVLPAFRRQGLGLALLQYSFGLYWQRGIRRVGLGVDATSLTGATRLYEKAGMHVHHTEDIYEKELRPGHELSKQG